MRSISPLSHSSLLERGLERFRARPQDFASRGPEHTILTGGSIFGRSLIPKVL